MSRDQGERFLNGEGDAWFLRNQSSLDISLDDPSVNFILNTLSNLEHEISKVLEIGCGGGAKLSAISRHLGAKGFGIDPSIKAIEFAKGKYPSAETDLNFITGLAGNLPWEDETFDLVFLGFFLYLLTPNEVFESVAETNRVLRPGGFLAILDFDFPQLHL